jgi:hypothetical protein
MGVSKGNLCVFGGDGQYTRIAGTEVRIFVEIFIFMTRSLYYSITDNDSNGFDTWCCCTVCDCRSKLNGK